MLVCAALAAALGGCGAATRVTQVARATGGDALAPAPAAYFEDDVRPAAYVESASPMMLAQATTPAPAAPVDDLEDIYDPWESFNEKMFDFNRGLDRWVLKPMAKGYNKVMPDVWQEAIGNAFDNIAFVPRFVNCLLQGKFAGAGREILRFVVNSSIGLGGLMDIAKREGFEKCKEDLGQTLGVWGFGPGPYLVLPFLPPLTVRDAVGFFADGAMNPLSYFIPFLTAQFPMKVGETVNDRSENLDLYQGFEESTVEFYSALRNAYLQRRQKLIQE